MQGPNELVKVSDSLMVESKPVYEFVKRIQDTVMAVAALILLAPVWLLIAVAVKLSSPGPAIFRQKNAIGRYGKPIVMYKFRTMTADNDTSQHQEAIKRFVRGESLDKIKKNGKEVPIYKLTGDPRVTRFGRFLRKTGLDEIPQLINVIQGDLSIVGPRPPLDYEFAHYTERHKRRLDVLPGITGLYQVTARSQVPFEKMVEIDLEYIGNRSYWLDLKIMLKTPLVLLTAMGAY